MGMYTYIYMHIRVYLYVCLYVCMYICIYVYLPRIAKARKCYLANAGLLGWRLILSQPGSQGPGWLTTCGASLGKEKGTGAEYYRDLTQVLAAPSTFQVSVSESIECSGSL